jgi:hypothetical protein
MDKHKRRKTGRISLMFRQYRYVYSGGFFRISAVLSYLIIDEYRDFYQSIETGFDRVFPLQYDRFHSNS